MKDYPPACRAKARHPRVPAFLPVPQRIRRDGWTPERQAHFLAELAITRSVSAAARRVGMARESAYRLRRKRCSESFAAAWEQALGRTAVQRKVTAEEQRLRALNGLLKPRIRDGAFAGMRQQADDSALLGRLAHLSRAIGEGMIGAGRSQSFVAPSESRSAALPHGQADPICEAERPPSAQLRGNQ